MDLIKFNTLYPDEESCKAKFKELRESRGIVCAKCGCREYYWKNDKQMYECKHCGFRTSLKSGTVMHKSKLSFRHWLLAVHLVTATRKGFSTKEIQRQLGHKRYEPVWLMVHKLRAAMGKRDGEYQLCGTIELDEGFFTTEVPEDKKDEPLKRGRGSQRKAPVLVMVESEPDDPFKGKGRKAGHLKMAVLSDLQANSITPEVKKGVNSSSTLDTDDSTSYGQLKKVVARHRPEKVEDKKQVGKKFPWVHIAITNLKNQMVNNHHKVDRQYLQFYLNEFCYKFNRRWFKEAIFDRLLLACVSYKNQFRYV